MHRRGGARRVRAAGAHRGHHPRARVLARARASSTSSTPSYVAVCLSGRGDKDLAEALSALSSQPDEQKTLVIYLVCEPETPELARPPSRRARTSIELGFPFSDPLADGPVIQRASERALARGMRTAQCLECLAATRAARRRDAARADDLRGAPRGVRLGAIRDRRPRRGRDEPDRGRRPGGRSGRSCGASTSSRRPRPTSGSRSPHRATDGWLYLVTLTGTTGARDELSSALAGLVGACARAGRRRAALRRLRHLDARAGGGAAALADGVVVGSRAVQVAEDGPEALGDVVAPRCVPLTDCTASALQPRSALLGRTAALRPGGRVAA